MTPPPPDNMEIEWSRPVLSTNEKDLAYFNYLYWNLYNEVRCENDDAQELLGVLHKSGFHHISEDEKLYVLFYMRSTGTEGRPTGSVWQEIIKRDQTNTMIALLPLTPLFTVAKDSIPRDCMDRVFFMDANDSV